jgi:hypothetical protein
MQDSRCQDQQSEKHRHDYRRHDPVGQAELKHGRSLLFGGSVSLPSVTGGCRAKDGDPQIVRRHGRDSQRQIRQMTVKDISASSEEMTIRGEREAVGRLYLD